MHGLGVVLVAALGVHVDPAEGVLGRGEALVGRAGEPVDGLVFALRHASAVGIEVGEVVLGRGEALLGSLGKPLAGQHEVAAYALAHGKGLAVLVLAARIALLGSRLEELGSTGTALGGALAGSREGAEHVAGFGVLLGGQRRQQLDGLGVVAGIEGCLGLLEHFRFGRCGFRGGRRLGRFRRLRGRTCRDGRIVGQLDLRGRGIVRDGVQGSKGGGQRQRGRKGNGMEKAFQRHVFILGFARAKKSVRVQSLLTVFQGAG